MVEGLGNGRRMVFINTRDCETVPGKMFTITWFFFHNFWNSLLETSSRYIVNKVHIQRIEYSEHRFVGQCSQRSDTHVTRRSMLEQDTTVCGNASILRAYMNVIFYRSRTKKETDNKSLMRYENQRHLRQAFPTLP